MTTRKFAPPLTIVALYHPPEKENLGATHEVWYVNLSLVITDEDRLLFPHRGGMLTSEMQVPKTNRIPINPMQGWLMLSCL